MFFTASNYKYKLKLKYYFFCLSLCLSICLSVYPSACLSVVYQDVKASLSCTKPCVNGCVKPLYLSDTWDDAPPSFLFVCESDGKKQENHEHRIIENGFLTDHRCETKLYLSICIKEPWGDYRLETGWREA